MQNSQNSQPAQQTYDDDEISLIELWQILARRKMWILLTFTACVLAGIAYILLAPARYEVEVHVDKPFPSDLAALNLGRTESTGLAPLPPEQVFGYFTRRLLSTEAKQRFFHEVFLPAQPEDVRENASTQDLYEFMTEKTVTVKKPDPKGRDLYSLRIEARSSELAAQGAQAFLDLVAEDAANKLIADLRNEIDLTTRNTQRSLEEQRRVAAENRADRVVQLSEALQVAQSVGIRDPQITSARPPSGDALSPFMDGSQLYARGTRSLSAELEVLKERESDDPFLFGLRETEAKLRLLQEINPDPKTFRMFNIDGEIVAPEKPFKPKKRLVLALAAVLGVMGGVMLAFVAEFVTKAKLNGARA